MSKTITKLYDNEWLSLLMVKHPEKNINGYVYSHESRCAGKIISILPYRYNKGKTEFLLRKEITPCWSTNISEISSITGGYEPGMSIEEVVLMELEEEAGYIVDESELIHLGTCRGTKSSDTIYYLFSVNLTNRRREGEALGDGSELEKQASCFWTYEINSAVDPLVYVMYHKLMV